MAVQDAQAEAQLHDETLTELGLTEQPFLDEKDRQPFADSGTQRTRAALEQNVRFGESLHLLIGEDGAGKTVLLKQLLKHCKNSMKPFVAKGSADFRADAFLYAVLHDINKEEKAESTNEYIDKLAPLFEQITDDQRSAVMIVDDAHLAPIEEIAELVDILQHFENEDGRTARLLLTGTPALKQSIAKFEAQFEDLDLNYSTNVVEPMDESRTRDYLNARLHQSGFADAFPFTDKAVTKIQRESNGLPGKINTNATHYLNGVYRGGAANDAKGGLFSSFEWPVLLIGAAALGAIGLGLSMFFGNKPETEVIPVASTESVTNEQPVVATTSVNDNTQIASTSAATEENPLVLPSGNAAADTIDFSTKETIALNSTDQATDLVNDPATNLATEVSNTAKAAIVSGTDQATTAITETVTTANDAVTNQVNTDLAVNDQGSNTQINDTTGDAVALVNDTAVPLPNLTNTEDTGSSKSVGSTTPDSVVVAVDAANDLTDTALLQPGSDESSTTGSSAAGAAIVEESGGVAVPIDDDTDAASQTSLDQSLGQSSQPVAVEPIADGVVVSEPNRAIENERWVLFQSPTKFTVQLATSRERGYIIDLAQTMEVQDPVAIYPFLTTNSNNPVFGLLSGLYDTRAEAIAAVEGMTDATKQFGVWIRPVSDLQDDIKRRN